MDDGSAWFAPKRYGIGAGWPISWQGWLVTLAYLAIVVVAAARFEERPLLLGAIAVPATVLFFVIVAKTTRGGWRWRWGDYD